MTVLSANVHPFIRPQDDRGPVDGSMPIPKISFVMKPSPEQLADRNALLTAIQDPSSPVYHQWFTPETYAARFGASPATIARMTAWLQSQGFTVTGPSRTRTQLFFSGTAAQVAQAFDTELHHYEVAGEKHIALSRAPSVPSDFASATYGLHGLHDFRKHPPKIQHRPRPLFDAGTDNYDTLSFSPSDYATIYDIAPLYTAGIDGTGQSIVIIGQSDVLDGDIAGFRTLFALPASAPTFTKVLVPGTGTAFISPGDVDESELDLEWSGAVARNAQIIFVYTGDSPLSDGVDDSLAYAVDNDLAPIMSESYGGCDAQLPANANLDGEVAAAGNLLGITILAAAGDSGASGCFPYITGPAVGPPADLPGVISVGGTEFCSGPNASFPSCTFTATPNNTQVPPYWSAADVALEYPAPGGASLETVWNDSTAPATGQFSGPSAGGGGPSAIFPKPFWQVGVTPNDGWRDTPDVSLSASPDNVPYVVYDTNGGGSGTLADGGPDPIVAIGGTSCATPAFAGIMALVNHDLAKKNGVTTWAGLGNANPELYALNKSVPTAFHDITIGNNDVYCTPGTDPDCPDAGSYGGFNAGVGYDEATGLGTVDANNLVTAWAALNPTTTTLALGASTAALGGTIQLNATIASNVATPAMTGMVSFTFVTYASQPPDLDGGTDDSWLLGSVAITPTTVGGKAGGTATLTTAIPPGVNGKAQVVAMYNGDSHYLWSQSARSPVSVTGLTLALSPATATLAPNAPLTITATGGVGALTWQIVRDSTYSEESGAGANLTPATNGLSAAYTAGPEDGESVVQVIDADGQDAFLTILVVGGEDAGAAQDSGTVVDSGPIAISDSGPIVAADSGSADAGSSSPAPASSGCSCVVAGAGGTNGRGPAGPAALGGLLFGLAVLSRRRRGAR